jgi:biotin operon repressor
VFFVFPFVLGLPGVEQNIPFTKDGDEMSQHGWDWTKLKNAIVKDKNLSPYERLVCIDLLTYADSENNCYPSISRIAEDLGISESTVRRAIKELEAKGYITIESRKDDIGRDMSNQYHLAYNDEGFYTLSDIHPRVSDRQTTLSQRQGEGVTETGGGCHRDRGEGVTETPELESYINENQLNENQTNENTPPNPPSGDERNFNREAQEVFDYYVSVFYGFYPRGITLTKERKAKIQSRLKAGYTIDDIKLAIDNIRQSPFHCGDNDKGKVYATIEFICRNDAKLEEWMNYQPRNRGHPKANKLKSLYEKYRSEEGS